MEPSRVTQRDVARHVGKDVSTVSLALRGHPSIPEGTRQRIVEVATALGYRRDPVLSASAQRRRRKGARAGANLAILDWTTGGHPGAMIGSMIARARGLGYAAELLRTCDYPSSAALDRVLKARGILGILLLKAAQPTDRLPALDWESFSVVALSVGYALTPFHTVTVDAFAALRTACRTAWERGYRRMDLLLPRTVPGEEDGRRLGAAMLSGQLLPGLRVRRLQASRDARGKVAYLPDSRSTDAVCLYGRGYQRWADSGIAVPGDIGVLGLNVGMEDRETTGIEVAWPSVSLHAVDFLDGLLQLGDRGIPSRRKVLHLDPVWREGQTLPPR